MITLFGFIALFASLANFLMGKGIIGAIYGAASLIIGALSEMRRP